MEAAAQTLRNGFLQQAQSMADQVVSLAQQVESLQVESDAWKAHNRDLTAQNKLLTTQNAAYSQTTLVPVLIDGDGALFDEALLRQGREGGKLAASRLRQVAVEQAEMRLGKQDVTVMAHVFTNKLGLASTFEEHRIIDLKTFDQFCLGFNQASPLFNLTDVGSGKEAADAKIKDTLRMFASFPQTGLVLLGGAAHDAGYTPMLSALKTDGLIDKVVLLKSYKDMAFEVFKLDVPAIEPEGLFIKRKLVNQPWSYATKKSFSSTPKSTTPSVNASGASFDPAPKPQQAPILDTNGIKVSASKYRSVPCWRYHLLSKCAFKEKCTFSHEPITEEQRQDLRVRYASQADKMAGAPTSSSSAGAPVPPGPSPSPPPPPGSSGPAAGKINKADFKPLLDIIKQLGHGTPNNAPAPYAALKSQVGAHPMVLKAWKSRDFGSFKEYAAAAENLGLVKSWRPDGPGSDLIGVAAAANTNNGSSSSSNVKGSPALSQGAAFADEDTEDEVVMEFQ